GSDSDASYDFSAVFNIPLADNFAIRIVAEKAEDGGFIDNVFGHTPDGHSIWGHLLANTEWGTADNAHVAEENWNSIEYTTARFSARWEPNENWAVTFAHVNQSNDAHGENSYNPFVGDLQTIEFNPYIRKDDWNLSSLTIEADLGWAQLVSSTSFFKRDIDLEWDTTIYSKYYAIAWYNCYVGGAYNPRYCLGPNLSSDFLTKSVGPEYKDRFAQEIRLSNQGDDFDWLVGLYYEDGNDEWESHFGMPTNFDYQDSISLQYYEEEWGMALPEAYAPWLSTDATNWKQTAIFGEFTWHINDKTDLTMGGRYFKRDND
ncbi:MAG: TonB-dependent receptor, partial [Gammaproteobacteria bacterium]|nr:TonB-dependent receptor [Gammaproteobacteria bacterium]